MPKQTQPSTVEANLAAMDEYIENLLKACQLNDLPEDYKAQYKEELAVEIQQRMGMAAMENLDEKGMAAYLKLMENLKEDEEPDPAQVAEFFQTHVPDYDQVVAKELEAFAKEYIDNAQSLRTKTTG